MQQHNTLTQQETGIESTIHFTFASSLSLQAFHFRSYTIVTQFCASRRRFTMDSNTFPSTSTEGSIRLTPETAFTEVFEDFQHRQPPIFLSEGPSRSDLVQGPPRTGTGKARRSRSQRGTFDGVDWPAEANDAELAVEGTGAAFRGQTHAHEGTGGSSAPAGSGRRDGTSRRRNHPHGAYAGFGEMSTTGTGPGPDVGERKGSGNKKKSEKQTRKHH